MLGQNHFAEPNRYVLTFLHRIFFFCRATYWALLQVLWVVNCDVKT
jgi:hypothetical protein